MCVALIQSPEGLARWRQWWRTLLPMQETRGVGSIPGLGRSPGGGHGNPLQYSCLENPMDRRSWWATVHGVTKSWTRLKWHGTQHACALGRKEFCLWSSTAAWTPARIYPLPTCLVNFKLDSTHNHVNQLLKNPFSPPLLCPFPFPSLPLSHFLSLSSLSVLFLWRIPTNTNCVRTQCAVFLS